MNPLLLLHTSYKKILNLPKSEQEHFLKLFWGTSCSTFFATKEYQEHCYMILNHYRICFKSKAFKELFRHYFRIARDVAETLQNKQSSYSAEYYDCIIKYKLTRDPFNLDDLSIEKIADELILKKEGLIEKQMNSILENAQEKRKYFQDLGPKIDTVSRRESWVLYCIPILNKSLAGLLTISDIEESLEKKTEKQISELIKCGEKIYKYFKKQELPLYRHYLGLYKYFLYNQQQNNSCRVQEIREGDLYYFGVDYKKYIPVSLEDSFLRVLGDLEDLEKRKRNPKKVTNENISKKVKPVISQIKYQKRDDILVANFDVNDSFINIAYNSKTLRASKGKLRNSDLKLLAELIKAKGRIVLGGNLKEVMGYEDLDYNNRVINDSVYRLKEYADINFIKTKRGMGRYLD